MRRGRVADWPAPLRAGLGQKAPPPGPPLSSRGVQFPCIHGFPACVIDGWAIPSAGSALVPPDLSIFCAPMGAPGLEITLGNGAFNGRQAPTFAQVGAQLGAGDFRKQVGTRLEAAEGITAPSCPGRRKAVLAPQLSGGVHRGRAFYGT